MPWAMRAFAAGVCLSSPSTNGTSSSAARRRPTWITTAKPGSRPANGREARFVTWALNRATVFGMVMRAQHREDAWGRYGGCVPRRCDWVPAADPAYVAYHDEEWGVPSRDDRHLFERITQQGAPPGLLWSAV